jgi:hypothetical protein
MYRFHHSVVFASLLLSQSLGAQSPSKPAKSEPPKTFSFDVTEAMGSWTGTLTISPSGIRDHSFTTVEPVRESDYSVRFSDLESCAFLDATVYPHVVVAGKSNELGVGPSLWILVVRKEKTGSAWGGFVVAPEQRRQFFEAAKAYGKYCRDPR